MIWGLRVLSTTVTTMPYSLAWFQKQQVLAFGLGILLCLLANFLTVFVRFSIIFIWFVHQWSYYHSCIVFDSSFYSQDPMDEYLAVATSLQLNVASAKLWTTRSNMLRGRQSVRLNSGSFFRQGKRLSGCRVLLQLSHTATLDVMTIHSKTWSLHDVPFVITLVSTVEILLVLELCFIITAKLFVCVLPNVGILPAQKGLSPCCTYFHSCRTVA